MTALRVSGTGGEGHERERSQLNATPVTPNDSTGLTPWATRLYVGITGGVRVYPVNGTTAVQFYNVQGGSVLPISVKQVYSTGTSASGIVALHD